MTPETINWIEVDGINAGELPDADLSVLIATHDGEWYQGFLDGTDEEGPIWRDATAVRVTNVRAWANVKGPT